MLRKKIKTRKKKGWGVCVCVWRGGGRGGGVGRELRQGMQNALFFSHYNLHIIMHNL